MKSKHLTQSLNNYAEWQQNKLYEGHLTRLKKIHTHKPLLIPKPTKINHSSSKHKTLPSQVKSSHLAIPLVPDSQGKLISSTLYSKNMSLREKEHLLQNYLLGRRILATQSVFNTKEVKKEYRMHRRISRNMSKSLKNKSSMLSSRSENFNSFMKETRRQRSVGFGKHEFYFTINKIIFIKGFLDKGPSVNYSLRVQYGKRSLTYQPFQYSQLVGEEHLFKYKKSHIMKVYKIKFELLCYRQNVELSLGEFELDLNEFHLLEGKTKMEVKNISKKNFIIGTVSIQGYVKETLH